MRDQQFVFNAREKNRQNLKEMDSAMQTIEAKALDAIQKKHDEIKQKIEALQEEKAELLTGEITKNEVIKDALSQLKVRRSRLIERYLKPHLESCKGANLTPFTGHLLPDEVARDIIYLVITEKDIKETVSGLPDTGITEEERKTKVKALDQEISELLATLKAEY
jgi:hypothetical protein